ARMGRWCSCLSSFVRSARARTFLAVARTLLACPLTRLFVVCRALARVVARRVVVLRVLACLVGDRVGAALALVAGLALDLAVLDLALPAARLLAARL